MAKGLGEVLKEIRLSRGISLRELSEDIGISHAYINKLEKGINPATGREVTPTMDTIVKIANGLSMPVKELLEQCGYLAASEADSSAADLPLYLDGVMHTLLNGEFVYKGEPVSRQKLETLVNAIKIGAGVALNDSSGETLSESSRPAAEPAGKAPRP